MGILHKIRKFHSELQRSEFYDFYALVTSMGGPPYDHILVDGQLVNVKRIIRKLRITIMHPRFDVDYADAYTTLGAKEEREHLLSIYDKVQPQEKNLLAKLIKALEIIEAE